MVPEVVGTIGMSSASVGIDHGMRNCGAKSLMIIFLHRRKWNYNTPQVLLTTDSREKK